MHRTFHPKSMNNIIQQPSVFGMKGEGPWRVGGGKGGAAAWPLMYSPCRVHSLHAGHAQP